MRGPKEMRSFSKIEVTRVVSEPGDMTRYDYLVVEQGDEYKFIPYNNTFPYPNMLTWWQVKDLKSVEDEELRKIAEIKNCNPWTVMECVRTIKELRAKR